MLLLPSPSLCLLAVVVCALSAPVAVGQPDGDGPLSPPLTGSAAAPDGLPDLSPWCQPSDLQRAGADGALVLTKDRIGALSALCGFIPRILRPDRAIALPVHHALALFASFCDFPAGAADLRMADLLSALRQWDLNARFQALHCFAYIDVNADLIDQVVDGCRDVIVADLLQLAAVDPDLVVDYLQKALPYTKAAHDDLLRSALVAVAAADAGLAQHLLRAASDAQRPYLCAEFVQHRHEASLTTNWALLEPLVAAQMKIAQGGGGGAALVDAMVTSVEDQLSAAQQPQGGREFDAADLDAPIVYSAVYGAVMGAHILRARPGSPLHRLSLPARLLRIVLDPRLRSRPRLIAAVRPHLLGLARQSSPDRLSGWDWPQPDPSLIGAILRFLTEERPDDDDDAVVIDDLVHMAAAIAFQGPSNRAALIECCLAHADRSAPGRIRPELVLAGLYGDRAVAEIAALLRNLRVDRMPGPHADDFFTDLAGFAQRRGIWARIMQIASQQPPPNRPDRGRFLQNAVSLLARTSDPDSVTDAASLSLLEHVLRHRHGLYDQRPLLVATLSVLGRLELDHLLSVLAAALVRDPYAASCAYCLPCLDLYDRIRADLPRYRLHLRSALLPWLGVDGWLGRYGDQIHDEIALHGLAAFRRDSAAYRPAAVPAPAWAEYERAVVWMLWAQDRRALLQEGDLIGLLESVRCPDPYLDSCAGLLLHLLRIRPGLAWRGTTLIAWLMEEAPADVFGELFCESYASPNRPKDPVGRSQRRFCRALVSDMIPHDPARSARLFTDAADATLADPVHAALGDVLNLMLFQYDRPSTGSDLLAAVLSLVDVVVDRQEQRWLLELLFEFDFPVGNDPGRHGHCRLLRGLLRVAGDDDLLARARRLGAVIKRVPVREFSVGDDERLARARRPGATSKQQAPADESAVADWVAIGIRLLQLFGRHKWLRDLMPPCLVRNLPWAGMVADRRFRDALSGLSQATMAAAVGQLAPDLQRTVSAASPSALAEAIDDPSPVPDLRRAASDASLSASAACRRRRHQHHLVPDLQAGLSAMSSADRYALGWALFEVMDPVTTLEHNDTSALLLSQLLGVPNVSQAPELNDVRGSLIATKCHAILDVCVWSTSAPSTASRWSFSETLPFLLDFLRRVPGPSLAVAFADPGFLAKIVSLLDVRKEEHREFVEYVMAHICRDSVGFVARLDRSIVRLWLLLDSYYGGHAPADLQRIVVSARDFYKAA